MKRCVFQDPWYKYLGKHYKFGHKSIKFRKKIYLLQYYYSVYCLMHFPNLGSNKQTDIS